MISIKEGAIAIAILPCMVRAATISSAPLLS